MKYVACQTTALIALFSSVPCVAQTPRHDVQVAGHAFSLPANFAMDLAAGPPLVERPITVDFDDRGRLYVAESSGTNDPVQKQLAERPHRILRLVDTDGDGRFDTRTVFADKMMFPEGTMWHDGSLYVAAPPHIWKLTDTDDDGVADKREIWFDGKTLTGCANDLHGPYLGPDGYIYWCKGAFAEQTYGRADGSEFKTRAAHIFRRRADGAGPVEPVMTGGMDNPVDVVFLPNGDRIFTTTFLVHPGGGQRDGLIHAVFGGIYGKIHDPIFEPAHKWTSPDVMPVMVHLGPAAPCGLSRYESAVFGDAYRDNLFACLFNMHKVTRHVLTPEGATYAASTEDFLVSPDVDFHPTDVVEDADGSLLVVNTGGWYKLCCPTSQLHKPDVPGAIYRIRRSDADRVDDPRGAGINWDGLSIAELFELLDDQRPAIVRRATTTLTKRPIDEMIHALRRLIVAGSRAQRLGLVSIAARIDHPDARKLLGTAATDTDPAVRTAARNALTLLPHESLLEVAFHVGQEFGREPTAEFAAKLVLDDPDPISRRAGLPLLGRARASAAVPAILTALASDNDRALDHALTYALIEIADRDATARGLGDSNARVRRAALFALDQMGAAARLDPSQVASWMTDSDADLRRSAAWVVGRHVEWGNRLAPSLGSRLAQRDLPATERADLAQQLGRLARSEAVQTTLANLVSDPMQNNDARAAALAAMNESDQSPLPDRWVDANVGLLVDRARHAALLPASLRLLRGRKISGERAPAVADALNEIANDGLLSDDLRLAALGALPEQRPELGDSAFRYVLDRLSDVEASPTRSVAVGILARAALSDEQSRSLALAVETLGPMDLGRVLPAFEKSSKEEVGRALLHSLKASQASATIHRDQLKAAFAKQPDDIRAEAAAWAASIHADEAQQHERIESLLHDLPSGEVRRGQAVFNGQKAVCSSCHAIGYLGGNIGPDLTRIGSVRTERDLLESIVYPSASLVRSYEPVTVATRDGRVINGLVKRESSDELILTLDAQNTERIARHDIEEMRPGAVSIMPAGFDQQLSTQEIADLIAFLKACR